MSEDQAQPIKKEAVLKLARRLSAEDQAWLTGQLFVSSIGAGISEALGGNDNAGA